MRKSPNFLYFSLYFWVHRDKKYDMEMLFFKCGKVKILSKTKESKFFFILFNFMTIFNIYIYINKNWKLFEHFRPKFSNMKAKYMLAIFYLFRS